MRATLALLLRFVIGGLLAALLLIVVAAVETAPRVPAPGVPESRDAAAVNRLLREVQAIRAAPGGRGTLVATAEDIDGAFRLLHRAHPALSGDARILDGRLVIDAALALGAGGRFGWLNATAVVPPFADGLAFEELRIGRVPLPPAASAALLRRALNSRFGAGSAPRLLAAAPDLVIAGEELRLAVELGTLPRGNLQRLTVGNVYGRSMPSHAEVAAFVTTFQQAVAEGRLPSEGSFLPWLHLLVDEAAAAGMDDPERALIGGLVALNYLCGSVHFVGLLTPRRDEGEAPLPEAGGACAGLTLRDRVDTRRHFLTAATLQALSDRGPAVVAGEAKELLDSIGGAFDFTDIAANNSGIRLATLLLATPPGDWPMLRARMGQEGDILIALDGIPGEMPGAAFRDRFGEVDSPAYAAMLALIEGRIDALPIHAAAGGG
jgi:hypothetical protein